MASLFPPLKKSFFRLALFNIILLFSLALIPEGQGADSAAEKLAVTPPMGWNSYDAYGDSVTEAEMLANAAIMKEKLLQHGWNYLVVDYRWYDPEAHDNNSKKNAELTMDGNGRLLPSPNRFPSAADGNGFKALADKAHAMGFKFGIHIMRGIPRMAVKKNLPIEGSDLHAWDSTSFSTCRWCYDMLGVDGQSAAGQAWYDSLFRLYASWGLDFVKADDLSRPYSDFEVAAIRKAIDKCGRPIVFSTSPGETPIEKTDHLMKNANMWRVSDDFWDNWKSLDYAFDLAERWQAVGGPGHWPDADMIPFGKLSLGHRSHGEEHLCKLNHEEQQTLMTLWCLMPSPLILGGSLADYPADTLDLITNDEALAVNQDSLGAKGKLISKKTNTEIWAKELGDGSKAVGLFNRGEHPRVATLNMKDLGILGSVKVRDLWSRKDLTTVKNKYTCTLPPHGSRLLKIQAEQQ